MLGLAIVILVTLEFVKFWQGYRVD